MDIVFVQGLKVDTVIGIYDWGKENSSRYCSRYRDVI